MKVGKISLYGSNMGGGKMRWRSELDKVDPFGRGAALSRTLGPSYSSFPIANILPSKWGGVVGAQV